MDCPNCGKKMRVEVEATRAKLKTDEVFLRTVYACDECGAFAGIYLPKK